MLKQNHSPVKLEFVVLLIIIMSLFILTEATAQVYSFDEIRENFIRERSQTGNDTIRQDCFGSIDDLILGSYPPLHPDAKGFFENMMKKTLLEIQLENVTEGATIWQIYNHGFVVKTPSMILGFDLYDYFNTGEFMKLANLLDVYFISHAHGDHFSQQLLASMKSKNKPVVGPAEWDQPSIKMNPGDSLVISGLSVVAHFGLHSVPVRQFEVVTPGGLKLLHTGDNQTSATLPGIADVDVMMLNAWINESGATSHVEGVRIAINKIKPKVTLPGHILEVGHLGGYIVSYRDALESDDGSLASEYYVLGWGERYHFDDSSNDSIRPNIVENISYKLQADSINFNWELPQAAEDGDSACFYRIIIENKDEVFTTNRQYMTFKEVSNFKVYCYDDCGNQSESYAEYENFPPQIVAFSPAVDTVITEGDTLEFFVEMKDEDNDTLFCTWSYDDTIIAIDTQTHKSSISIPFPKGSVGKHLVKASVSDGRLVAENTWDVTVEEHISAVQFDDGNIPTEDLLEQNCPNPFNQTTTIRYELPNASKVILITYDILGREIQTLVNDQQKLGRYAVTFDASKLASGVYFYKLQTGSDFVEIKKMLLLR